jgi:hypothetical protein
VSNERRKVRLSCQIQRVSQGVDASGPQTYLGCGFLSGDVQDRATGSRSLSRNLQEQGGFADARFTSDEDDGTFNEATPQHAIKFAHTTGRGFG